MTARIASAPRGASARRIVIACALQDAGEATRSVAIATALRDLSDPMAPVDIVFLTHGSRFEPMVREAGLAVHRCSPAMGGRSVVDELAWQPPELVGSAGLAAQLIQGERRALEELRPAAVIHGFWPFANLAARMLDIPTIAFLPIPLHPVSATHGLMTGLRTRPRAF